MKTLTPEAEEFFLDQWSRNVQHLEDEHGITTPYEYLDYVGKLSDFDDPEGLKSDLEERGIPIDIYYQIAPMVGQDVMYASLNPGMQNNLSPSVFEKGNEYGRKIPFVGDPEGLAWSIAKTAQGYLTSSSHPGVRLINQSMRENMDPLSSDETSEDYVDIDTRDDLKDSYFGQIYLTRLYKFPSPSRDELTWPDIKFGRRTFAEEVGFVDPKILVCGCRDAWMAIYREMVEDPQDEIEPHNGSTVSSKYGGGSNSTRDGVFYVPDYDLWVVTVGHEGWRQFIDEDRLVDNLAYANERISW